jgi:glycosyltransferase involved in cell wall biosynthesis
MKVLIDATPVQPNSSGIGLYVYNLLEQLYKLNSLKGQNEDQNSYEFGISYQPGLKKWLTGDFLPTGLLSYKNSMHSMPLPEKFCNPLLINSPELFSFLFEPFLNYPNIIHGTNYAVYPFKKSLKILNIYDLTFIKYPEYVDSVVKEYIQIVKKCLTWTDLVITISESIKQDIIEYLNVAPEKVYVTPLASRYENSYLNEIDIISLALSFPQYCFNKPYLLFVSTIEPRKNINTLITAFNLLKQKYKIPHDLVLIGQKGWNYTPIFEAIAISPYQQDIYHLDYLSDQLVAMFYAKADVFVYPSHYEGFGLPILEAMIFEAPVVTSNVSSMPEVAGDAALLVDPNDPEQLSESILRVISDLNLRNELIKKGRERAKSFSWEKTAQETIKAYKMVLR